MFKAIKDFAHRIYNDYIEPAFDWVCSFFRKSPADELEAIIDTADVEAVKNAWSGDVGKANMADLVETLRTADAEQKERTLLLAIFLGVVALTQQAKDDSILEALQLAVDKKPELAKQYADRLCKVWSTISIKE